MSDKYDKPLYRNEMCSMMKTINMNMLGES